MVEKWATTLLSDYKLCAKASELRDRWEYLEEDVSFQADVFLHGVTKPHCSTSCPSPYTGAVSHHIDEFDRGTQFREPTTSILLLRDTLVREDTCISLLLAVQRAQIKLAHFKESGWCNYWDSVQFRKWSIAKSYGKVRFSLKSISAHLRVDWWTLTNQQRMMEGKAVGSPPCRCKTVLWTP